MQQLRFADHRPLSISIEQSEYSSHVFSGLNKPSPLRGRAKEIDTVSGSYILNM
jgi:hypothetical protein